MRDVIVKADILESGIGSIPAELVWESDPTELGELAHLSYVSGDDYYLSITDMEEHSGSYVSVRVTPRDLRRLASILEQK